MADSSSSLKAVVGWAGGIVAAVLTAVLIARFTGTPKQDPQNTTNSTPVTLDIDGYIFDSGSHAPVRNATISLTLGNFSGHQRTDATGKYRIILNEPVAEAAMTDVAITAPGYQPFQNTMAVTPPTTYAEILIDAVPPAVPPPPPGPTNGGAPAIVPLRRAQILIKPLPFGFVKGPSVIMSKR